jgi:hypothetical protein
VLNRFGPHPGHATVVAYLALFVALGGSSYAALSINGRNIENASIAGKKLKNRTIDRGKVRRNALTGAEIRDRSLLTKDFRPGELPAGPQGAQGPPGAPGATGSPAASMLTGNAEANLAVGISDFLAPSGPSVPSGNPALRAQLSPNATVVMRDLAVKVDMAPSVGHARTFTLYDNGSPTPLACTVTGTQTTCNSGDATATVGPGHELVMRSDVTGSPSGTTARWAFRAVLP